MTAPRGRVLNVDHSCRSLRYFKVDNDQEVPEDNDDPYPERAGQVRVHFLHHLLPEWIRIPEVQSRESELSISGIFYILRLT